MSFHLKYIKSYVTSEEECEWFTVNLLFLLLNMPCHKENITLNEFYMPTCKTKKKMDVFMAIKRGNWYVNIKTLDNIMNLLNSFKYCISYEEFTALLSWNNLRKEMVVTMCKSGFNRLLRMQLHCYYTTNELLFSNKTHDHMTTC